MYKSILSESSKKRVSSILKTLAGDTPLPLTSQVALVVKNSPASAGDRRDMGSIPGLGKPAGRPGYPLQYSCLEHPLDRGARRATARRAQRKQQKRLTTAHHFPPSVSLLHRPASVSCVTSRHPRKQEHISFNMYLFLFGGTRSPLLCMDFL